MAKSSLSDVDRFWLKVRKADGDACWEWTACRLSSGYGQAAYLGRPQSAHRVSWQIAHGPIPAGQCVLHRCDNKPCVRPDHLFLGTITDNNRDAAEKNRCARLLAKLTVDQVHEIRLELAGERRGYRRIASKYGVLPTLIGKIARGETWGRV